VFATRIPCNNYGNELTINWHLEDFDNQGIFYTDSNSLEMIKRITDFRYSYTLQTTQKVVSNFYPVDSAIMAEDTTKSIQATIQNDRSESGSVYHPGRIELLINRRTSCDDNLGMC